MTPGKSIVELTAFRDMVVRQSQEHLGKFNDVQLSYWKFNNYRTCPQQFALQIGRRPDMEGIRKDSFWALAGSVVHGLSEDFIKGVKAGKLEWTDSSFISDNVVPYYDEIIRTEYVDWKQHGITPEQHRASVLDNIRESALWMYEELTREGLIPCDPSTIHTELSFRTQLTPHVVLTGRSDLVFEHPDSITIVDPKDVNKRSAVNWRQLVWYTFGLEPVFNKPVARAGFCLTKLKQWSWRNPNAKEYRETLMREILETAIAIRREPFRAVVNRHHCSWCPVNQICPEWQQYAGRSQSILDTIATMDEGKVSF